MPQVYIKLTQASTERKLQRQEGIAKTDSIKHLKKLLSFWWITNSIQEMFYRGIIKICILFLLNLFAKSKHNSYFKERGSEENNKSADFFRLRTYCV